MKPLVVNAHVNLLLQLAKPDRDAIPPKSRGRNVKESVVARGNSIHRRLVKVRKKLDEASGLWSAVSIDNPT
jgi:hypothetical protein